MRLYCGIDLHGNNAYLVVIDEFDRVLYRRRLPNDLAAILAALSRTKPSWWASLWNRPSTGTGWSMA